MELLDASWNSTTRMTSVPGVYDIHSPRVPTASEIEHLLRKALKVIQKNAYG